MNYIFYKMSEVLISILPFFLIIAIWIIILFRVKKSVKTANNINTKHDEIIDLLKEISIELKVLNKK